MVGEEGDLAWEQNKVNIKKQQQVCENTQHKHTYKYINIKQMEYFFFSFKQNMQIRDERIMKWEFKTLEEMPDF